MGMIIEEGTLIPGKWYKGDGMAYMKFSHIENRDGYSQIYLSEQIRGGKHTTHKDYWSANHFLEEILKGPVDISIISEYLPKDHPDINAGITYEIY